jgi:hypothetical protein
MIHAILICYHNPEQTRTRWERDLLPGLAEAGRGFEVTCVDNSPAPSPALEGAFGAGYLWQGGRNLMYGPSLNLAVPRIPAEFVLYACTRHGRALDTAWVCDLLDPMLADPRVALAGHLTGSSGPETVARATGCPWVADAYRFDDGVRPHVQGGVFAARAASLLAHPYPPGVPHAYTDHVLTWALMKAGFRCADVPGVRSVWRDVVRDLRGVKYVHDEAHT